LIVNLTRAPSHERLG